MTRDLALEHLKKFIFDELNAKRSGDCFYLIDGGRICRTCRENKRRTLYMVIKENMPVMLKCFRLSCSSDIGTKNRAKLITRDDLFMLGFTKTECVEAILNTEGLLDFRSSYRSEGNIIIHSSSLTYKQSEYIKKRTWLDYDKLDLDLYHILPDLKNVVETNDIKLEDDKLLKNYNMNNSISFLCDDTTISSRAFDRPAFNKSIININNNSKMNGYRIGPKLENISTLVVTEGIFDIINAYNYFAKGLEDTQYVATLGFDKTLSIIEHYFYHNIDTLKHIIIFLDSDIRQVDEFNNSTYTYNEKALRYFINDLNKSIEFIDNNVEITICWNTKSKDIGDLSLPYKLEKKSYKDIKFNLRRK